MPFLPFVIADKFHQSSTVIGLVLATYPVASLIATPWASRLARSTPQIIRLHSIAVLGMVVATLLFSTVELLIDRTGTRVALGCVFVFRAAQGVANAVYLASNTSLVTRNFATEVPYVIGMAEVAVGVGAQIGRLVGGFLYDQGGFACPFFAISIAQAACAMVGFTFSEDMADPASPLLAGGGASVPWSALFTPRMMIACAATLLNYLLTGFYDGTLPLHLENRIGKVSVSEVGLIYALRSISYMIVCYVAAQVMRKNLLSFEMLIAAGSLCGVVGLLLVAPESIVIDAFEIFGVSLEFGDLASWIVLLSGLVISSAGCALLLVPSLPLMQAEAKSLKLGNQAVEQTASLFMAMMSVGEASGPVFGGWAVTQVGFKSAAALFSVVYLFEAGSAFAKYDAEVVSARSSPARSEVLTSPALGKKNPRWRHGAGG